MTSELIAPVASTSSTSDYKFTSDDEEESSTDEEVTEKQTISNIKKRKKVCLVGDWLRMVEPRTVPYFPQKNDKVVYLRQAHECYLKEVKDHNIFDVTDSDKLWVHMKIDVFEYLKVTNITFKKYPTRITCLEVQRLNEEEQATKPFKLRYHELIGVVDFLVLEHIFTESLQKKWDVGNKFRCLVDDRWFFGTIESIEPFEQKYPQSPFQSFQIKWADDGKLEQISPWEIKEELSLQKNDDYVIISKIEILEMQFVCFPGDMPTWEKWKARVKNMISKFDLLIDELMHKSNSKCFVEITKDPIYDASVSYSIDLSTILERLKNNFYRRIDPILMDVLYLEKNARKYKTRIEEAQHIAEVCKDIISEGECSSSFSNLQEFLKNNDSLEFDSEFNKKERQSKSKSDWNKACERLLNTLWDSEDTFAFRRPVSPDNKRYYKKIKSPICLEEIKRNFEGEIYKSPKDMFEDIKLLIKNSRIYNKDKTGAMYRATTRVKALFKELKKQIHYKKENPRKKNTSDVYLPLCKQGSKNCDAKSKAKGVVCKNEIEAGNPANIDTQQKGETIRKNSIQDETAVEASTSKNNDTNLIVEAFRSSLRVAAQNKGKENRDNLNCNNKTTIISSNKRKLVQFTKEKISNESPEKKLHISSKEINTQNTSQEAHPENPNEAVKTSIDECDNKTNNSKNSEFDNESYKINKNDSTNQSQNSESESSISLSLISDVKEQHFEAPNSFEKVYNMQRQVDSIEKRDDNLDISSEKVNTTNIPINKNDSTNQSQRNCTVVDLISDDEEELYETPQYFEKGCNFMQPEVHSSGKRDDNLNILSVECDAINIPQETHLENTNVAVKIDFDESDSRITKSQNFKFNNEGSEINENSAINQSQRDYTVVDLISDNEEELHKTPKSLKEVYSTENKEEDENLDISSVEINITNIPEETHPVNPNGDVNKSTNSKNSDNEDCKVNEMKKVNAIDTDNGNKEEHMISLNSFEKANEVQGLEDILQHLKCESCDRCRFLRDICEEHIRSLHTNK